MIGDGDGDEVPNLIFLTAISDFLINVLNYLLTPRVFIIFPTNYHKVLDR